MIWNFPRFSGIAYSFFSVSYPTDKNVNSQHKDKRVSSTKVQSYSRVTS